MRRACFSVIRFRLYIDAIPTAPTGKPPARLSRIVTPASLGRLKTHSVIFENILPNRCDIPNSTTNVDKNINGKSDGTRTVKQALIPSFMPLFEIVGAATMPMHRIRISKDKTINESLSSFSVLFKEILPFCFAYSLVQMYDRSEQSIPELIMIVRHIIRYRGDVMKSEKDLRNSVMCELANRPVTELWSNRKLTLEGCRRIEEYNDNCIKIKTSDGTAAVYGRELTIAFLSTSAIIIEGYINRIEFEEWR